MPQPDAPADFGDSEPEDAWHPLDAVPDQIRNLKARAALLLIFGGRDDDPPNKVLDQLEGRVQRKLRDGLSDRDFLRVTQILEDIPTVRAQIS